jgi:hypothetical protein
MATTVLDHTGTKSAEIGVQTEKERPVFGFEVEFSEGVTRRFDSAEEIRAAILLGEVPKAAHIRALGASPGGKTAVVEEWAKSHAKLRSLYTPVWSLSLRGAFVGLIVVGVLKSLDTFALLFAVNPAAAILWLLIGVALFSPKWKLQLMVAVFVFGWNSGLNVTMLWGAWFGVAVFAAVFGITAGMPVGTIIGLLRARHLATAPDAAPEGSKPLIWGLAVPLAVFGAAAIAYVQIFMPAIVSMTKG